MKRVGDLGERRQVWWCIHGEHVDENHRAEGNYLDLCSRAGCGGVCELRSTSVVKEPRHRSRRTPEQVRDAEARARAANAVKIYKGTPFQPEGVIENADADAFEKSTPKADFLTDRQREQFIAGEPPPLVFARSEGMPPVVTQEIYEVTSAILIQILGTKETSTQFVVLYNVVDTRSPSLRIKAKQPPVPESVIGMPKTEFEPEPISRKETSAMARMTRAQEIVLLEASEADLEENLKELEGRSTGAITFQLRRTLKATQGRRERLEKADREDAA